MLMIGAEDGIEMLGTGKEEEEEEMGKGGGEEEMTVASPPSRCSCMPLSVASRDCNAATKLLLHSGRCMAFFSSSTHGGLFINPSSPLDILFVCLPKLPNQKPKSFEFFSVFFSGGRRTWKIIQRSEDLFLSLSL